jgi:uncharacterized membrane protein
MSTKSDQAQVCLCDHSLDLLRACGENSGGYSIHGVIQNNQPLFLIVWVGSTPALLAAAVLGAWALDGADRVLMMVTAAVYILCVQLPTLAINIPLNNELQKLDSGAMTEPARSRARDAFEARWNRWNAFRTECAGVTSVALMLLLLRA